MVYLLKICEMLNVVIEIIIKGGMNWLWYHHKDYCKEPFADTEEETQQYRIINNLTKICTMI